MTTKPNLYLAKMLTETYIESANSTSDLVLFTADAYEKLDQLNTVFQMTDDELIATRDMINTHLTVELMKRLGVK